MITTTTTPSVFAFCGSINHPHMGTEHCLRDHEASCLNDHTGCLYNNGHNECGHEAALPAVGVYDCPLRKVRRTCGWCKVEGYGFRKCYAYHFCPKCYAASAASLDNPPLQP